MAAVGSVVVTKTRLSAHAELIKVAWTSAAGGGVSGNPFSIGGGALQQVKFVPGSGGTQPSNSYGVTVLDGDGCDMAVNKGASLSNTAASLGVNAAPLSWLAGGTLDVNVSAAGNAKTGTVYLLVVRV